VLGGHGQLSEPGTHDDLREVHRFDELADGLLDGDLPHWRRAPQTAHGAAAYLAQAYPGRFTLGLGAGSPPRSARTSPRAPIT